MGTLGCSPICSLCVESAGHTWTKFFSTFKNISTFLSIREGFCRSNLRLWVIDIQWDVVAAVHYSTVQTTATHELLLCSRVKTEFMVMGPVYYRKMKTMIWQWNSYLLPSTSNYKTIIVWKQELLVVTKPSGLHVRITWGLTSHAFYGSYNKSTHHPCSLLNL